MPTTAAELTTRTGHTVPLLGVNAEGKLTGLLFELTVEQRWHNAGNDNLEAIYTFPVPHNAVLLGLELEIGDRHLHARAQARRQAAAAYEEAVDNGHTAALLEQTADGVYTVNLGNLQAGEHALVRYRYAQLLDQASGSVRLTIPTVIAPRSGSP